MNDIRHWLYSRARTFIEGIAEGSEGEVRSEAQEAIRCLDALFTLDGRICVGPVDGEP